MEKIMKEDIEDIDDIIEFLEKLEMRIQNEKNLEKKKKLIGKWQRVRYQLFDMGNIRKAYK